MSLSTQFLSLVTMVSAGAYLGCMFDTIEVFSPRWKGKKIFSYVIEISFWLLQTLFMFYLLLVINNGEINFYFLVAIYIGFTIYQHFLARGYKVVLAYIIKVVNAIYQFFYRCTQVLLVQPVIWLLQVLLAISLALLTLIGRLISLLWMLIYVPIRTIFKLFWMILPKNAQKCLVSLAGFYSKIENIINNRIINKWKRLWEKWR
ncbi:spore cortex biosynthesis protein YabQ [Natronobacillus azotifigens]|uniref:Spore cortex biosynthesis protein YabQ n=1 Tax=Natronobacillus azotifigens TaxID=472978 RepID=A0A9J6REI9_9BACI|nr:spore cortex biosynthesis protein YabQ [Natronobacillus azotifigens]MCZ0703593.1 spore cortex biosynthesis protein YabQ [Natronobacillus azotifigens]